MNLKILLVGKNGQVGSQLCRLLPNLGQSIAFGRKELDLTDLDSLRRILREVRPQLIVNAAAYTAVDRAETEHGLAQAVNADAPAVMAEEAASLGSVLVHYSTDYVFDGTKGSPYTEADPPNPLSIYGATKLAGENAIRACCPCHFIFRTAWVYSTHGSNFLLTTLKLATEREELRMVSDQIGAPTWSREIATGTVRILARLAAEGWNPDSHKALFGTCHMTAAGETSRYVLAQSILEELSKAPAGIAWIAAATGGRPTASRRIIPIATSEYPTPARRPAYSVLSNARLLQTFHFQLPAWREQLHDAFRNG